LPDQRRASATQRHSGGHFAGTSGGPRQQQSGDIHAANKQHQAHRGPQDEQRPAQAVGQTALEGDQAQADVVAAALLQDGRADGLHLTVGLRPRDAGTQAAHRDIIPAAALAGCGWPQRRPQVGRRHALKAFGQHANDGVRLAAQGDRLPHNRGVFAKQAFPNRVTQHCDGRTTLAVFNWRELASDERRDSQHAKKTGRDALLFDVLDAPASREVDALRTVAEHGRVQIGGVVAHRFPDAP